MLTLDSAKHALRSAGVRITPQRLMVVEVLVGNRSHPTVESVYDLVRTHYPTISLATVYHTLAMLARHGLILELHGGKEGLRCDPDTKPHAHAYCERCEQVFDLPLPNFPAWDFSDLKGFQSRTMDISLYGICDRCASAH